MFPGMQSLDCSWDIASPWSIERSEHEIEFRKDKCSFCASEAFSTVGSEGAILVSCRQMHQRRCADFIMFFSDFGKSRLFGNNQAFFLPVLLDVATVSIFLDHVAKPALWMGHLNQEPVSSDLECR